MEAERAFSTENGYLAGVVVGEGAIDADGEETNTMVLSLGFISLDDACPVKDRIGHILHLAVTEELAERIISSVGDMLYGDIIELSEMKEDASA